MGHFSIPFGTAYLVYKRTPSGITKKVSVTVTISFSVVIGYITPPFKGYYIEKTAVAVTTTVFGGKGGI